VVGFHLVSPEPKVTVAALHQGVGEVLHVTAGLPDSGVHQDSGVQPYHVVPLQHHGTPPGLFHVAFQLHPQGAVVVGGTKTAVNFATLENKPPAFGEGKYLVHIGVG
jgi:hypothetical protein